MINKHIYRQLKQHSPLWAGVWVVAEYIRIIFASVLFLFPYCVLVAGVFSIARTSWIDALRFLLEWQLYAFLFVISIVNFVIWRLAEYVTSKALCLLDDEVP